MTERIINSQHIQMVNDLIGTSKLTLAHRVELRVFLGDLCDVVEAARDAISECDLSPDSPLPDGRSWCCAHQDWDYADGPHCAMAELRTALGKISTPAGEIPQKCGWEFMEMGGGRYVCTKQSGHAGGHGW